MKRAAVRERPGGNDELWVTRIHRFASCDASPSLVGGAGEGEAVEGGRRIMQEVSTFPSIVN